MSRRDCGKDLKPWLCGKEHRINLVSMERAEKKKVDKFYRGFVRHVQVWSSPEFTPTRLFFSGALRITTVVSEERLDLP